MDLFRRRRVSEIIDISLIERNIVGKTASQIYDGWPFAVCDELLGVEKPLIRYIFLGGYFQGVFEQAEKIILRNKEFVADFGYILDGKEILIDVGQGLCYERGY